MSSNGPVPICAICSARASQIMLFRHGTDLWLCLGCEEKAGDCLGVHAAAELLEAGEDMEQFERTG